MNTDAIVLGLVAIGDLALLVHLRQRRARQVQLERIMASLYRVVRRENSAAELSAEMHEEMHEQLAEVLSAENTLLPAG